MNTPDDAAIERIEEAGIGPSETTFELTLFVSGASDFSARAIANARHLCETHLRDRYRLAVVDLHDDPAAVRRSGVLATPTLVKHRPLPVRKFIGDLSRTAKVLQSLGIPLVDDVQAASG